MSSERQTASTLAGIHWGHRVRYEFATKFMNPGDRVLDIGCANGYGCSILAVKAARVVGLDIAPVAINQAKHDYPGPNIEHMLCDCTNGFMPAEPFELVTAFEVIEHVDDPAPMLRMAYRALVPNGRIVCSMPNGTFQQLGINVINPWHKRHYTSAEFAKLLEDAGFVIESVFMQTNNFNEDVENIDTFCISSINNLGTDVTLMVGVKYGL